MAEYPRLKALVDAINLQLPDGYVMGYELGKDEDLLGDDRLPIEGSGEASATRFDAERKAAWRARLTRYQQRGWTWAADDLAAIPADGADMASRHILFEILHVPTGIRAIRVVAVSTLVNLLNDDTRTLAQKRTIVRNQVLAFLGEVQARVAASGWSG